MRHTGTNAKITINHFTVSYTDEGPDDAPVIIFIHGFPFNKSMWNGQVEALTEDYRVIAYDVRGHGNSDSGTEDFSIELFTDDLLTLMDALKIETAMLCGLSMGGYIALNAIINFPERFNALLLCDTTCMADKPETREKRMKTIENIRTYGVEQYASESIKNLFAAETFVTGNEKVAMVKDMIMKTSKESLCSTLYALARRKETCNKLADITIPVLILVGKEDQITPPAAALLMQKNIKGSTLNIIEHAGHLSNIENTHEFNNQIKKFVYFVYQASAKLTKSKQLTDKKQDNQTKTIHEQQEKDLNSKILKITMIIKEQYPELLKYLDEMPVTVPSEKNPEITLKLLTAYYESLNSMLNKYKLEYPKIEQ